MIRRQAPALALALLLLGHDGRASNGLKPNAAGVGSFGRGGADIAWAGDATVMSSNPAAIVRLRDELTVAPIALFIDAKYGDAGNSRSSRTDFFPYANAAVVFDPPSFGGGESPLAPPLRAPPPDFHEIRAGGEFVLRAPVASMPARATADAGGSGSIRDLALVAAYYRGTAKEYSTVLATAAGPFRLSSARTVASFGPLVNHLSDPPEEIALYGTVDGHADVRLGLDGHRAASESVSGGAPARGNGHSELPLAAPREDAAPAEEPSPIKFGVGLFVQAGAGTDFTIATSLYPDGVRHMSDLSFVSVTPTVGYRLLEFLAVGASLHISTAQLRIDTPITQSADIMQGPLFPAGSLDAALNGAFGIPSQFGPAMKYAMDTSDQHAPGASITHSAKPNDPSFGLVTGTAKLRDADSVGLGGRFGLQALVTDRLTLGLTFQTQSYLDAWHGRAHIDYDRQIAAFVANPTQGHSDEISVLGVPTEMRFTYDQVWNQGTVDVYTFGVPAIPGFPLPSGPIVANLPNGGANGFQSDYDMRIGDFQLPAEIGAGASYRLTDRIAVMADVKRIFWSRTMDDFIVELRNGSNPDVNALIGSSSLAVVIPLDWKDQDVFAVGSEIQVLDWLTLRAGYNYAKNPAPADTLMPLIPGIVEHHASFGFSIRVGSMKLDAGLMHAFENTVRVGQSAQTSDLDNSKLSVSQDFFSLGFRYDF